MPASAATKAATANPAITSGPDTAYAAPTRRKIAAPTIAPRAAIVTSKSPRSRETWMRTEPEAGAGTDTHERRRGRYLSLWRRGGRAIRSPKQLRDDFEDEPVLDYDSDFDAPFAIRSPSVLKATSTFSPVFAELKKCGASNASVACLTCSSPNAAWSFRSLLLIANVTGISPTVRNTDSTHESRSSSVS